MTATATQNAINTAGIFATEVGTMKWWMASPTDLMVADLDHGGEASAVNVNGVAIRFNMSYEPAPNGGWREVRRNNYLRRVVAKPGPRYDNSVTQAARTKLEAIVEREVATLTQTGVFGKVVMQAKREELEREREGLLAREAELSEELQAVQNRLYTLRLTLGA